MKVASNVKAKPVLPGFLKKNPLLFCLFHGSAQGIYPYIFVPKEMYDNLNSQDPDLYHVSVIVHEQTHLDRQKVKGWFSWMTSYVFIPKFRFDEELEADRERMKYMKKHKLEFPFEKRAKMLSGRIYLWPVTYDKALRELKLMWEDR